MNNETLIRLNEEPFYPFPASSDHFVLRTALSPPLSLSLCLSVFLPMVFIYSFHTVLMWQWGVTAAWGWGWGVLNNCEISISQKKESRISGLSEIRVSTVYRCMTNILLSVVNFMQIKDTCSVLARTWCDQRPPTVCSVCVAWCDLSALNATWGRFAQVCLDGSVESVQMSWVRQCRSLKCLLLSFLFVVLYSNICILCFTYFSIWKVTYMSSV